MSLSTEGGTFVTTRTSRRQLLTQTGRDDIPSDLARDRVARAEVLLDMGQHEVGKKELEAIGPEDTPDSSAFDAMATIISP